MTIFTGFIVALWAIFVVYWWIAAIGAKRNLGRRAWGRGFLPRLIIFVLVLLAVRIPGVVGAVRQAQAYVSHSVPLGVIGVLICALGVGLCIWARVHLGRNWGMPMSHKENPELVSTGPYASIRHPIYTGMLLAMLGSALAASVFWGLVFICAIPYFIYSARQEEKLMVAQFPEQYPAYMKRTRMLIPFVL